jgi:hypothetical protein
MVGGQQALAVVTDGVRVAAHRSLGSALTSGAGLSPPKTAAEEQYATPGPAIILPKAGLSGCGLSSNTYSQLSVMQWGVNPYAGSGNTSSTDVQSPILRFSNTGAVSTARRSLVSTDDEDPYFIVLQLVAVAADANSTDSTGNATIPSCTLPSDSGYIPCPCNVSAVSATNVTYRCLDISFICPSASRRLQTDDDGGVQGEQSTSMSDYGALLASLLEAAKSVLSQNPFTINLAQARDTLIVVALLLSFMFGGCFYFSKWDSWDKNALIYLKNCEPEPETEAESEKKENQINLKSIFFSRSSRRVAMNFSSLTGVESYWTKKFQAEYDKESFDTEDTYHKHCHDELVKQRNEHVEKSETFFQSILPESTLVERVSDLLIYYFFQSLHCQSHL